MLGFSQTQNFLWTATIGMEAILLGLLIIRRHYRDFPFFSTYVLGVILQSAVLFFSYRRWGYGSHISVQVAWISQGVVILLRALVVAELCRRLVGPYRGIWALTWRILLACAAVVLSYSLLFSQFAVHLAIVNADRGLELTIATVVVVLFLFACYYGIAPDSRIHFLAVGLCLYSCIYVLNDTFLERWMDSFSIVWNYLGMVGFLVSMVLWLWGFRKQQTMEVFSAVLLPKEIYKSFSPQLNLQLRHLNDRLSLYWQVGEPRP
ncbi:MAG: hypothetical protein PVS2B2_02930 [Candidatus Acidiferrum sp.]